MIQMNEIHIRNFLGLQEFDFSFSDNGLFLILGQNGSGKSSFLDSILWVIYGKIPRSSLKKDDIVNEYSDDGCYVELLFTYNNQAYFIRRSINHSEYGNGLELFIDGVDSGSNLISETQKIIEDIFGEYYTFINTIIFPQSFKDTFLGSTDSLQKQTFERILNLQYLTEYGAKSKNYLDGINNKINELTNVKIYSLNQQLVQNKNMYDNLVKQIDSNNNILCSEIKSYENKISDIDVENIKDSVYELVKNIEIKNNDLIKNQNILDNISIKIKNEKDAYNNKSTKLKNKINNKIDKYKISKQKSETELKTKYQNLMNGFAEKMETMYNCKIDLINNQISELEDKSCIESKKYEDQNTKILDELGNLKNELSEIMINQSKFNNEKNMFNSQLTELENAINMAGPCPTCQREMDDHGKSMLNEKINNLTDNIKSLDKILDDIYVSMESKNRKIFDKQKESENIRIIISNQSRELDNNKNLLAKNIKLLEDEKKTIISDKFETQKSLYDNEILKIYKSIDIKIHMMNNRIETINNIINNYNKNIDENNETEMRNMNNTISNIKDEVSKLNEQLTNYNNKYDEYEKIQDKIKNHRLTIKNDENRIIQMKEEFDKKEIEIETTILSLTNQLSEIQKDQEIAEFWYKAFKSQGIKNYIIGNVIPNFNNYINSYLKSITDRFTVKIYNLSETQSGSIQNKINVKVYREDGTETKFAKLSGGEKRILDIPTMMSLHEISNEMSGLDINVSFADEIFDSLDDEHAQGVVSLLKNESKHKSTYICTHNEWWKNQDVDDVIEFTRER